MNQSVGALELSGGNNIVGRATGFAVIEDLLPVHNVASSLRQRLCAALLL